MILQGRGQLGELFGTGQFGGELCVTGCTGRGRLFQFGSIFGGGLRIVPDRSRRRLADGGWERYVFPSVHVRFRLREMDAGRADEGRVIAERRADRKTLTLRQEE